MKITFKAQVALFTDAASGLGLAAPKASLKPERVRVDWNEDAVRSAAEALTKEG